MHFSILNTIDSMSVMPAPRRSISFNELHTQFNDYIQGLKQDRSHLARLSLRMSRLTIATRLNLTAKQTQELQTPLAQMFEQVIRPAILDMCNPHNRINVYDYQASLALLMDVDDEPPVGLQLFLFATYHHANMLRALNR